jgi:hypothetical protein
MTIERLLVIVSRIIAEHPNAVVRCVLNYPEHYLIFVENEVVVAQVCIESGEVIGDAS